MLRTVQVFIFLFSCIVHSMKTTTLEKTKKDLEKISHEYIRRRDGFDGEIKGKCFDCGKYGEGKDFQAGHFFPSGNCGFLLRFHPKNMHGQHSGCNCYYNTEQVKINYTQKFLNKYGEEYLDYFRKLKIKSQAMKPYKDFYETLLNLYKEALECVKLQNDITNINGRYDYKKKQQEIEDYIDNY